VFVERCSQQSIRSVSWLWRWRYRVCASSYQVIIILSFYSQSEVITCCCGW